MNVFNFVGNLGSDCKVDALPNGTPVCRFSVAVKSGYGDNAKTSWVICSLFGKRAEGKLPQYLVKGTQVAVSGELSLDEWVAQDGTNKSTMKVMVNNLTLVGGQSSQGQAAPAPQQAPQQSYQQPQQPANYSQQTQSPQQPQNQQQAPQQPNYNRQASLSAPQQAPQAGGDQFSDDIPF